MEAEHSTSMPLVGVGHPSPARIAELETELRATRRVLDVSTSGDYAWRSRPPSARAIRHAWLTDLVLEVHQDSRGVYGALRVHAELRLRRGIMVGHNAIELLMRRAGPAVLWGVRGGGMPSPTRSPPTWSTGSSPGPSRTSCG
jgi:HTH-like domain